MPGSAIVVWPTLIASDKVTKNQPPDIDIIMFQINGGRPNGTSMRQNRAQAFKPNMRPASSSSSGTVRSDWYKLNAMFQAWLVKMANTAASSAPKILPGASERKKTTVIEMK